MDPLTISTTEMILRLIIATGLGVLVGAQRSHIGKTAGMRTYALVALGSALFTIISTAFDFRYIDTFDKADPLRVASQILVGIGFLGAGVIFVQRNVVTGLTTAAGLWVVAGIGMAVGLGMIALSVAVTAIVLFIFTVLWYIESRFVRFSPDTHEAHHDDSHHPHKHSHRDENED
jgi:putative Mg2+ transporter-C (MgtC) family protein